jgi:hypothetical protein
LEVGLRPASEHCGRPRRTTGSTGARAGLFNTHFFVDRTSGICASIFTNSLPFGSAADAMKSYADFETAL